MFCVINLIIKVIFKIQWILNIWVLEKSTLKYRKCEYQGRKERY